MKKETAVEDVEISSTPALLRRVSWGAILAGLFVTLVMQVMFTLLGAAIGLASVDQLRQSSSGKSFAIGSGIWMLLTALFSIWIGACVSGRLCGGPGRTDGLIHGTVTWSVSTCATMLFLATATTALPGATGSLLHGAVTLGGSVWGSDQQNNSSWQDQLMGGVQKMQNTLSPTGRAGDTQTTSGRASVDTNQVAQAAETAREGASKGALWGFLALVLGLATAAWGGWVGTASIPPRVEGAAVTAAT
jgi:hypothetical protein